MLCMQYTLIKCNLDVVGTQTEEPPPQEDLHIWGIIRSFLNAKKTILNLGHSADRPGSQPASQRDV